MIVAFKVIVVVVDNKGGVPFLLSVVVSVVVSGIGGLSGIFFLSS